MQHVVRRKFKHGFISIFALLEYSMTDERDVALLVT